MAEIFNSLIVVDGGFATELQADGHEFEGHPLWSGKVLLTCPEASVEIHKRFLDAGARLILTNSYHATLPLLENEGVSSAEAVDILRNTVTMARNAVNTFKKQHPESGKIYVAGSVGPYSTVLCTHPYSGDYVDTVPKEDIVAFHFSHAKELAAMDVDILCFETLASVKEAQYVLEVLDQIPNKCAWISFCCKDSEYTGHGEKFSDAVAIVSKHPRVVAVGLNCTDPQYVTDLLKSASSARNGKPFVVYPNKGEIYHRGEGWEEVSSTRRLAVAEYIKEWIDLGATAIGGCCRVTADDIKQISEAMKNIESARKE